MATLVSGDGDGGDGGAGLPLQLTTITVTVPAPLSPNTTALLSVPSVGGMAVSSPSTPLTLPLSQQDCTFKWKYEQTKDKVGNTLVSIALLAPAAGEWL